MGQVWRKSVGESELSNIWSTEFDETSNYIPQTWNILHLFIGQHLVLETCRSLYEAIKCFNFLFACYYLQFIFSSLYCRSSIAVTYRVALSGNIIPLGACNKMSHDMTKPTKWERPMKTQVSLGICPIWSESSLYAQWVAKDTRFLHADSEDSDQTGQIPRLIWVFAGRTLILLVLSCCVSNVKYIWTEVKQYMYLQNHVLISASLSTQSPSRLPCPHEEALGHWLHIQRLAKALISLRGCAVWSESLLDTCHFAGFEAPSIIYFPFIVNT